MMTEIAPKHRAGGLRRLRWFVESMWAFWLLLLAVSFAAAVAVYYLWLQGGSRG